MSIGKYVAHLAVFPLVQRRLLAVFAGLALVDVGLTLAALYGTDGVYQEMNPILSWAVGTPVLFVAVLVGLKTFGFAAAAVLAAIGNRFDPIGGTVIVGGADLMAGGVLATMLVGLIGGGP